MGTSDLRIPIVYEDDDLVIVNKPAGLLSVPIPSGRVTNLLHQLRKKYAGQPAVTITNVHRIDRFTSGLVAFSKNRDIQESLVNQFRQHQPEREYLAVIRGVPEHDEGTLFHHLKRIRKGFRNIVVSKEEIGAAPARLSFLVEERFLATSLVRVQLQTGLKNQIRVQFKAVGHQLVGDQHYVEQEQEEPLISRQALHAERLVLAHPRTQKKIEVRAPVPADMLKLIEHYRWEKEMHSM